MLLFAIATLSTCLQAVPVTAPQAAAEVTSSPQASEAQLAPEQASPPEAPLPEEAPKQRATVVRGTRPAQSASEVTIGRDILDTAPRKNAVDVLRVVPGLVASQHSGEGKAQQLFLRGFDALHGQDVELNVGGLPVNEVSHIHALGYADTNFVIPELVQSLEVTEGSYRAFQGDFAVACGWSWARGTRAWSSREPWASSVSAGSW